MNATRCNVCVVATESDDGGHPIRVDMRETPANDEFVGIMNMAEIHADGSAFGKCNSACPARGECESSAGAIMLVEFPITNACDRGVKGDVEYDDIINT